MWCRSLLGIPGTAQWHTNCLPGGFSWRCAKCKWALFRSRWIQLPTFIRFFNQKIALELQLIEFSFANIYFKISIFHIETHFSEFYSRGTHFLCRRHRGKIFWVFYLKNYEIFHIFCQNREFFHRKNSGVMHILPKP